MLRLLVSCEAVVEIHEGRYYNNGLDAMLNNYSTISDDISFITYGVEKDQVTNAEVKGGKFIICHKRNSLWTYHKYKRINCELIEHAVREVDACIMHVPSDLGYNIFKCAKKYNKPCLLVVVGSAWDAFWYHSLKGKIVAPFSHFVMKRMVEESTHVIYVTEQYLQDKYPTKGCSISCSNVDLVSIDHDILQRRTSHIDIKNEKDKIFRIATLGTVSSPYKGQKYVISALSRLLKKGYLIEYYIVGGGNVANLKKNVEKLKVGDYVKFCGNIDHNIVLDFLDGMDLYVQPSMTEGLPRALIEAMSRGLPALASNVGGIPELLDKDYLFQKGNVDEITELIEKMYKTPSLLKKASKENIERSTCYLKDTLFFRRRVFLESFADYVYKKLIE